MPLILLVTVLICSACGPGKAVRSGGPVTLAYGGAAGDARNWSLEQSFRGKVINLGMPQLVVMKAHASMAERIESVEKNGWRRVRMFTDLSPIEFNGMAVEMGAVPMHQETVAMRSPTGETSEIEQAKPATDTLAWVARSLGSTFPLLPPAPVSPGETWRREQEMTAPAGGTFRVVTIGVFEGMEEEGGVVYARLRMEGGVNLEGAQKGADLESFRLEYKGTVRFIPAEGKLVDSLQEGTVSVKGRMGKSPLEALLLFKSSLVPADAPATAK